MDIPNLIPCAFTSLDAIARQAYKNACDKGFHDGEIQGIQTDERMAVFLANLHEECSEMWNAVRKGILFKQCDKDVPLTNAEEELADIVIRAFDTARSLGISIGRAVFLKMLYNSTRPHKHGKTC